MAHRTGTTNEKAQRIRILTPEEEAAAAEERAAAQRAAEEEAAAEGTVEKLSGGQAAEQAAVGARATAEAAELDALRRERDENYDRFLRKSAEFENYRKRVERERRELNGYVTGEVLRDLLPIIDNFERALLVRGADTEAYRKGVEIIHDQLLDLLKKRGVTPIDAVGAMFDPHLHQAVVYEPSPGRPDGEVTEEFQRGYKIGDRLLRPAMVKVAKA